MRECCLGSLLFVLLFKFTTSWINSFMNWPVSFAGFCTCSWIKATLCLLASAPAFSKASPFTLLLSLETSLSDSHTKKYLFPPVLSLVAFSPSLHCPQWWLPPGLYCGLSTDFRATQQLAELSSWNTIRPGCSLIKATGQPSTTNGMSKLLNRTNKFCDPISPSFPTP